MPRRLKVGDWVKLRKRAVAPDRYKFEETAHIVQFSQVTEKVALLDQPLGGLDHWRTAVLVRVRPGCDAVRMAVYRYNKKMREAAG